MFHLPEALLWSGALPRGPVQQVITTTTGIFSGTLTVNAPSHAATPEPTPVQAVNIIHGLLYNLPGWPRDNPAISFLLTLAAWAAIAGLAYWLLFQLLRSLVGRTRTDADNIVLSTIRVPLFVAIVAYGVVSAFQELELAPVIANAIATLYLVVLIAAGFYLAWRIVKEVVIRWLALHAEETESRLDDLLLPLLNTVGPLVFFVAALVFILQSLGVDVGLLAVSIGAVGLIIGLAFQESLSNLFSGIYLMIDPPFRENDLIVLADGKICGVQRVGLRVSQLYDMNNHALIYVPNNQLANATIANITKPTVDYKMSTSVRTSFAVDPEHVSQLLGDVLQSHRNILGDPAAKVVVLRRRLETLAAPLGEHGTALHPALADLDAWDAQRATADAPIHARLLEVRKQMNTSLAAAQNALLRLPVRRETAPAINTLRLVLGSSQVPSGDDEIEVLDAGRMRQIGQALDTLVRALPAATLDPLVRALAGVGMLDHEENQLDTELDRREQAREAALDGLLTAVATAGAQVAAALHAQGFLKEAARLPLWARNLAVVYAEQEVYASLAGLDEELGELIDWVRELEAGGLTKAERLRVRALFGKWGGVRMLDTRRVGELRRRILRWLEWRELDTLPPSEYHRLVAAWNRRIDQLSRRLRASGSGDEETLDTRLVALRSWLHSRNFLEPLEDWKLPGAGLDEFGPSALIFGMYFYVDDIKLEHFSRRGRVLGEVLLDVWEVFQREGIQIPVPPSELWNLGAPPPSAVPINNGGRAWPGGTLAGPRLPPADRHD